MNHEFRKMLKKMNLDEIIEGLLYELEEENKCVETYEERLDKSYDKLFADIESIYPLMNRDNNELWDVIVDFATIQGEVYFEIGIVLGFQIYNNLKNSYSKIESKKNVPVHRNDIFVNKKDEEDSLLHALFAQRMETTLEILLKGDGEYKKAVEIASESQEQLDMIGLDKKQSQQVDRAISATNAVGAEYGRVAYQQGFREGIKLISELYYMS